MKTSLQIVLPIAICLTAMVVHSQSVPSVNPLTDNFYLTVGTTTSDFKVLKSVPVSFNYGKLGINNLSPSAILDVRGFQISDGVFRTMVRQDPTSDIKLTVSHGAYFDSRWYGIYQTSYDPSDMVQNYFQDDIKIGTTTYYSGHVGTPSGLLFEASSFDFNTTEKTNPGVTLLPLSVTANGIIVNQGSNPSNGLIIGKDFGGIGNAYIGFNYEALNSDVSSTGGCAIFNSTEGDLGFWTIPPSISKTSNQIPSNPRSINQTRMVIASDGKIGFGPTKPEYFVDIILPPTEQRQNLVHIFGSSKPSLWISNRKIDYGFINDDNGHLVIARDILEPVPIVTLWHDNMLIGSNIDTTAREVLDSKLVVDGKILCEELKVRLSADWPDYVFSGSHELMPLKEVGKYIADNQHLPELPSATEVAASGIDLGAMNVILVKKIEELTLYILNQQKEIEELKARVTE